MTNVENASASGCSAFREAYHVPLAIKWANGIESPGRIVDDFTCQADMAQTFREIAGCQPPEEGMPGRSILPLLRDERPDDWRDRDAVREFMDQMRKMRENVDNASAEAMLKVLTDEQKAAYETASKAYEAYQAKIKEIDEAYGKKLVEAVGEEKAKELQQRRPPFGGFGRQARMGGDRRPAGGQRRRPGAEF